MKYDFKILMFILMLLMTTNCIPLMRMAKPLDKNEVQLAYHAPASGSLRLGLGNGVEYRVMSTPCSI